ncbi:MAG TPA: AMP-binding protein [Alphaproteobacteria bacterium]
MTSMSGKARSACRLVEALDASARRQPDRVAVLQPDGQHSYAQLARDVHALAVALTDLGVRPGDVVSAQLPNWIEAIIVHMAVLRIGAVLNPIVPIYREREIDFALREAGSRVLIIPGLYRKRRYADMLPHFGSKNLAHVIVCRDRYSKEGPTPGTLDFEALVERYRGQSAAPVPVNPTDDMLLIYTSGTTANPKGVRHNHVTMEAEVQSLISDSRVESGEAIFVASPLGHIAGIDFGIHLPFRVGAKLCLLDIWDPGVAAQMIERERCVWSAGAPPFLQGLLYDDRARGCDLSSLRGFRCGSADITPALIRDAHARGVFAYRVYGCTEHPSITGRPGDDVDLAANTDGKIFPGIQVRIVDPEDSSRTLPYGAVGEIASKGPDLFPGYKDESLNASVFDRDGWFLTGDLGTLDEAGHLTIMGRKKDIIIRKGENISARQIEEMLGDHPAIRQVAVIGMPDATRGERVCAVVTLRPGMTVDLAGIVAWLDRKGIARQKFPEQLEIVESMPTTALGKIQKPILRKMLMERN